ncbi:MAG: hypothetical protein EHM17_14435 [Verrucomicrobiaceae bacterium]|jgi:hypothetical protein|nr:MAG: hypothetical protein EHM17_16450 [Verrucomicrobiaceae bacterium]RPJ31988.1 MAG: hypothetical protein EHM17_14435 [Verrucomicrobiaceae bacterium]
MAFTSAPSYFSDPVFGGDTAGAFNSTATSLTKTPFGAGSSFKPTGMDPFSIGLGVASIGASIFGANKQQQAAEKQAKATEEAAKIAAASTEKAAKTGLQAQLAGQLGGFGLDYLTSRYEGGAGGALNRVNAARDAVQQANIQANNPSFNTLRSVERYEDRLRNAMPGYQPPSALFV